MNRALIPPKSLDHHVSNNTNLRKLVNPLELNPMYKRGLLRFQQCFQQYQFKEIGEPFLIGNFRFAPTVRFQQYQFKEIGEPGSQIYQELATTFPTIPI